MTITQSDTMSATTIACPCGETLSIGHGSYARCLGTAVVSGREGCGAYVRVQPAGRPDRCSVCGAAEAPYQGHRCADCWAAGDR